MLQSTVDVTRTRREDGSKLPRAPSEVAAAVDASPFPWSSARDSPVKYRKDFFFKKILSMWETLLDFYYGLVIVFLLDNFYFNHFKFLDTELKYIPRGHTNDNTFPWIQFCYLWFACKNTAKVSNLNYSHKRTKLLVRISKSRKQFLELSILPKIQTKKEKKISWELSG